jgi:hypothetical protein
MYIGPWQEFRLSKAKQSQGKTQDELRKEIENVLLQTLDPNAAETALKAMDGYFHQHQGAIITPNQTLLQPLPEKTEFKSDFHSIDWLQNGSTPRPLKPNPPRGQRHTPRNHHLQQIRNSRLPPLEMNNVHYDESQSEHSQSTPQGKGSGTPTQPLTTAAIMRVASSSQESYTYNQKKRDPSPLSVRSSQSEPIKSSNRLPHIHKNNTKNNNKNTNNYNNTNAPPVINDDLSSKAPSPTPSFSYDQNAIVNFLKMERNQRAKDDIYKITGWDKQLQTQSKLKPINLTQEQKLNQINQMKELYLLEQQQLQLPPTKKTTQLEPLINRKPVVYDDTDSFTQKIPNSSEETPVISDMDLTETDFMKVSKYFKQEDLSHFQQSTNNNHNVNNSKSSNNAQSSLLQTTNRKEEFIISSHNSTERIKITEKSNSYDSSFVPQDLSTSSVATISSPAPGTAYTGGVDNLLKWTQELNFDDFEL